MFYHLFEVLFITIVQRFEVRNIKNTGNHTLCQRVSSSNIYWAETMLIILAKRHILLDQFSLDANLFGQCFEHHVITDHRFQGLKIEIFTILITFTKSDHEITYITEGYQVQRYNIESMIEKWNLSILNH